MNPDLAKYNVPTRFSKENQPKGENRGRRKDRYKQLQKEYQLSKKDHDAVLHHLCSLKRNVLVEIANDPEEEIIIGSYARSLIKDYEDGNTGAIDKIVDRLFGRPVEKVETDDKTDYTKQIKKLADIRTKVLTASKTPLTENKNAENNTQ
jgi:hypothetical protein